MNKVTYFKITFLASIVTDKHGKIKYKNISQNR